MLLKVKGYKYRLYYRELEVFLLGIKKNIFKDFYIVYIIIIFVQEIGLRILFK